MNTNSNISEEELDLVERYILNNMSASERAAFSARLSAEADLSSKVNEVKLLSLGIGEAVLQEKLTAFHKELPAREATPPSSKISLLNRWLVAAAVIMIAGVGAWLLLGGRFSTEQKIYAAFYKPDPGLISAMSTTDNYSFDRAMIDYKTGDYDSAIKTWEEMLAANTGSDTLNYFIGSAWLAKEESGKAIPYFRKVVAVRDSYFISESYWYLGLALLKENKLEEAIASIEQSEHEQKDALLLRLKEKHSAQ